ncbi:MAG: VWA domain-containing protein [Spirochaetales bacterium]|nr:VWA domain-containing protein [Spirochaetales bacterium]
MNLLNKNLIILFALCFLFSCSNKSKSTDIMENEDGSVGINTVEMTLWPPELGDSEISGLEEDPLMVNYLIVLDGSGSMEGQKMQIAKEALLEFIDSIPAEDNLGLVAFDSQGTSERVHLSRDRQSLRKAITTVDAFGGTPLSSALTLGYESLKEQGMRQVGYGEYNLIIVTDGNASGGEDPSRIVDKILAESPVMIHTIGFHIDDKHVLNQPGKIVYKSAYNREELLMGLESILAESTSFSTDAVFGE